MHEAFFLHLFSPPWHLQFIERYGSECHEGLESVPKSAVNQVLDENPRVEAVLHLVARGADSKLALAPGLGNWFCRQRALGHKPKARPTRSHHPLRASAAKTCGCELFVEQMRVCAVTTGF